MDPILQFIAFGLWTFSCVVVGAVLGYLLRYTMEHKNAKPVCYGSKPASCTGKGSKPAPRNSSQAQRGATPRPSDGEMTPGMTDDDLNSNMGFEVMSDDASPPSPVPETTMPPPPPPAHSDPRPRRAVRGYTERGSNIPLYYTETPGTRLHTRQDCKGLLTVANGGRRIKDLSYKRTCSWCCEGVVIIPL